MWHARDMLLMRVMMVVVMEVVEVEVEVLMRVMSCHGMSHVTVWLLQQTYSQSCRQFYVDFQCVLRSGCIVDSFLCLPCTHLCCLRRWHVIDWLIDWLIDYLLWVICVLFSCHRYFLFQHYHWYMYAELYFCTVLASMNWFLWSCFIVEVCHSAKLRWTFTIVNSLIYIVINMIIVILKLYYCVIWVIGFQC